MSAIALAFRCALGLVGLVLLHGLGGCYQPVDTPPLGPGECRVDLDCTDRLTCVRDDGPIGRCQCRATSPACFNGLDGRACACDADGCSCQPAGSPAACPLPQPAAASAQCSGAQLCAPDGTCACFRDEQCPPGRRCQADDRGMGRCACPFGEAEDGSCAPPTAPNACGGEAPLEAAAGGACGRGDWGRWTCTGCDSARCCAPWAEVPSCCAPEEGQWQCAADSLGVPCCDPETEMPDPCGRCVRLEQLAILQDFGFVPGRQADDPCLPEADRPEVAGRWVCDARGQPRCLACTDESRNVCGGCGRLEVLGQVRSEDISGLLGALRRGEAPECDNARHGFALTCPGRLRCEGGNTVRCRGAETNACGDCGPVTVCTDATDGACCQLEGVSSVEACTERQAPFDLPGGLGALRLGQPCGAEGCGHLACEPAADGVGQVMRCEHPPGIPNACGGCLPLQPQEGHCRDVPRCLTPGEDCTTFGEEPGQWVCAADRLHVICVPSFRNECGGTQLLSQRPGTACVAEAAPGTEADACPSVVVCNREDASGNSTLCTPVARNACGCCESQCRPPFDEPPPCGPYGPGLGARTECLADGTGRVCVTDADADGRCVCGTADGEVQRCTFITTTPPVLVPGCTDRQDGTFECECVDLDDSEPNCGGRNERCCPDAAGNGVCPGQLGLECLDDPATGLQVCRCGGLDQACCGGVGCDDDALSCQAGRCQPCGEDGEACCPGNLCAAEGLSCQGNTCRPCGAQNGICCPGGGCANPGLTCVAGALCQACGGPNQPCCAGACNDGSLVCGAAGLCVACGGNGGLCCAGGACTGVNLECAADDRCRACGTAGQACCAEGRCGANEICGANALCAACGAANQPCCANRRCGANAVCGDNEICGACGGPGQQCCANATCGPGRLCLNNTCGPCGTLNELCCPGNACSAMGTVCNPVSGRCGACGALNQPCCTGGLCSAGSCDMATGVCL